MVEGQDLRSRVCSGETSIQSLNDRLSKLTTLCWPSLKNR